MSDFKIKSAGQAAERVEEVAHILTLVNAFVEGVDNEFSKKYAEILKNQISILYDVDEYLMEVLYEQQKADRKG